MNNYTDFANETVYENSNKFVIFAYQIECFDDTSRNTQATSQTYCETSLLQFWLPPLEAACYNQMVLI